jgi:16S rRNA C967 or C1407 C5-methylase (RsmB/RsmF family)/NOL1/NOP2/fmu family ribosome biogenesis protein
MSTIALPNDFETYTACLMGPALWPVLRQGLVEEEPPVSIRLNPFKTCAEAPGANGSHAQQALGDPIIGSEWQPVPWCSMGRYLPRRPPFTFDPLLHAGTYYVQEASSMFIDHVLRQLVHEPVTMLDLCAAPGGKSTTARAALPAGSLLFTNEPVKLRASILAENIQKFGHPDVIVTNNYPADYGRSALMFDVILTDVPCSGEGMFRKDAGAIAEWSKEHVEKCWQLQRSIVQDVWPCLRAGGLLIYSTCTFNAHEDEENVDWICRTLGAESVAVTTLPEWNITQELLGSHRCYRFLPGKTRGEGLFVAVLRKEGEAQQPSGEQTKGKDKRRKDRQKATAQGQRVAIPTDWLQGEQKVYPVRDTLRAIPQAWATAYEAAASRLHIIHAGVTLGTVKGRDIVPDTSLALSTLLYKGAFPLVELSLHDAISFLRKEAVMLPAGTPRGFVVVTYHGHPLGFEKNIGNRANNLYPQEWKIKTTHIPEEIAAIAGKQ